MGTNYYAVRNRPSIEDPIHIGKSSAGWMFLFQSQNEKYHDPPIVWNSFKQLCEWLQDQVIDKSNYVILDEYDQEISKNDFIKMVIDKQNDPFCRDNPENFSHARNVDGYRFTDEYFS